MIMQLGPLIMYLKHDMKRLIYDDEKEEVSEILYEVELYRVIKNP